MRIASPIRTILLLGALGLLQPAPVAACEWTHLARDPCRSGVADFGPLALDNVLWTAVPQGDETYVGRASPVVANGRVFVAARGYSGSVHTSNRLIAYDAVDGGRLWAAMLVPDTLDSWSTPCADPLRGTVLVASDDLLYAIRMDDGGVAWSYALERSVVNASPAVTSGLRRSGTTVDRALICDYDPVGGSGKLYAVNVDPFDGTHNPYQPGEIVWSCVVGGTVGASPAFADGVVYVAESTGGVLAIDVADGSTIWSTSIAAEGYGHFGGFFGGLTVCGGAVYGATYDFSGSGNNSGLVKLDAANGDILWAIACERTDSIPLVPGDGRVYLAAGLVGFGSAVKVQAFQDQGNSAVLLWDTHVATAGALTVGGWTHHIAYAGGYLYAGRPDSADFYGPYAELFILNTQFAPGDSSFIVDQAGGAGSSPAIADGVLYSIGTSGLTAFAAPGCVEDINDDGRVDLLDLAALLIAFGTSTGQPGFDPRADLNGNGSVDLADLSQLLIAFGTTC